jgi:hypothetical protein
MNCQTEPIQMGASRGVRAGSRSAMSLLSTKLYVGSVYFFFIWFVRLLALRPLLAYCASLG